MAKEKKAKKSKISCDMPEIKKTTIGGQALIEGVMMVGPKRTCIAVRKGDGTIHVEEIPQTEKVTYFETVPFIRGCIRFYKMLVTGTGALMKSADISEEGRPEDNKGDDSAQKQSLLDRYFEKHYNLMITLSAIVGIILSIGIFLLLPKVIVDVISRYIVDEIYNTVKMSVLLNLIEGFLRMMFFFIYLFFASKLKDVKRVWQYHGAEHKTIACYEAGMPLTPENVMKFPRFHPRCGTAFMFIVMAISILIYTLAGILIGEQNMLINILLRVLLVPVICGISFEFLRFVGRHDKNWFCRFLSKPGLWLQNFTTEEPDAKICEVAIASMMAVIPEDKEDDVW
ncbi:MAG: DUF1385 domain-containing protein [Clostridiales bacterium]|nr:DUF1385 domain-containing protein [Clostridiales bacterium]